MPLRIRDSFVDGLSRTATRNGSVLMAAYLLVILFQAGFVFATMTTYLPLTASTLPLSGTETIGPAPGTHLPALISLQAAFIGSMAGGLLTIPIRVIATRTLVSGYADHIPDDLIFHRLGRATVHRFIGNCVASLVVLVGSAICIGAGFWMLSTIVGRTTQVWLLTSSLGHGVLVLFAVVFVFPAAFFGINLVFVRQEISIRDKGIGEALAGSWRLARDDRYQLVVLVILAVVPQVLLSIIVATYFSPLLSQVIAMVAAAIVSTLTIGIMAPVYVQLADIEIDTMPYAGE